ncbi:MAG: DUF3489 domain-containing protein, partial [Thiobacillaceae bacterium]
GAKLKMIASLAQRGLIEQQGGQWRITRRAIALVDGEALPDDAQPAAVASPMADAHDVDDADAYWAKKKQESARRLLQIGIEGKPRSRQNSKLAVVIRMLQRPEGATIGQICAATGWQKHTVRGAISGLLKKRHGFAVVSDKPEGSERIYRII